MRLRTTGLVTAALLTAAPAAVLAAPASAAACTAPSVVSTAVSPRTVVLGSTGASGFAITVSVRANGCTLTGTSAAVRLPGGDSLEGELDVVSTEGDLTVYGADLDLDAADLLNADAGTWKVRTSTAWTTGVTPVTSTVTAGDDDGGTDDGGTGGGGTDDGTDDGDNDDSGTDDGGTDDGAESEAEAVRGSGKVAVLRASEVSSDLASSALTKHNRIKKGKALTIKGTLTRADWESGRDAGFGKQKVDLQFRTSRGVYKKVKSLKTGRSGAFAETVKVNKDGCYRVVYAGSATTAAAPSAKDCVDVR